MNKCIDCGKQFDPQSPGCSSLRGPVCNQKHLDSWTIPSEVDRVAAEITNHNFPVYLVGGGVRDYLLGRKIKDYDLVTSASVSDLEKLFPNALEVGKQFGIIRVPVKDDIIEIASFREDGNYSDGRRPDSVKPGTLDSDVERRDFTINGLLFDLKTKQVIDKVGGINDLNQKLIRSIGSAEKRFQEDHLRVLRALRFACVLDFKIEDQTLTAAKQSSPLLSSVSKERIKAELDRIFSSENLSKQTANLEYTEVLTHIFPHLSEANRASLLQNLKAVKNPTKELVYSWIFKDNTKLMNQYKLTNQEIKKVKQVCRLQLNLEKFESLPKSGQNQAVLDSEFPVVYGFLTSRQSLPKIEEVKEELIKNPINTKLLTSGKELIEYGFNPGTNMGKLIEELNTKVFGREINTPESKDQFIRQNKP